MDKKNITHPPLNSIYGAKSLEVVQESTAKCPGVLKGHNSASTTKLPSKIESQKQSVSMDPMPNIDDTSTVKLVYEGCKK